MVDLQVDVYTTVHFVPEAVSRHGVMMHIWIKPDKGLPRTAQEDGHALLRQAGRTKRHLERTCTVV